MLRHFRDCTIVGGPFSAEMNLETLRPGVSWSFDEERVGHRSSLSVSTPP